MPSKPVPVRYHWLVYGANAHHAERTIIAQRLTVGPGGTAQFFDDPKDSPIAVYAGGAYQRIEKGTQAPKL